MALQIAGFWEFYLLKNSLLWLVTVGFLGILTLDLKAVSNNTFKKFFKDIFKITIVFEFITATYVFSFGIEMLILLISIVLVLLKLFTETKLRYDGTSEYRGFQRFLNFALTSIGFIIIWHTSKSLIENPSTLLSLKKLKEFILPLILSLLYAPLYWLIICVTAYETSFKRIQYSATDNRINLFNKIIVFLRCGLSINRLKKLENSTNTFQGNQKELRSYIRNISFSRSTGLYKFQYGRLTELQSMPGSGSINDIIQSLGWSRNEIHVVHLFDSDIFEFIGFKILSKKPIFAQTRDGVKNLHFSVLNTTIEKIDWKTEYSADNVDDILNEGILNGDLKLEFLQKVILLTKISSHKYYCSELEMSFIFRDEKLIQFEHIEHLESSTKWLRSLNTDMYEGMVKEAEIYQKSKKDVANEVNKQSEALILIPKAVENEYIKLHRTKIGNTSFYNLRAAHYLPPLDKNEFLKVNSGRFKEIDKNTFNVDKFLYFFNEQDTLYKSMAC
ncbi:hypothetical protein [Portibacter lacus]|nr:hypothetical protein [Portibacter lacus]